LVADSDSDGRRGETAKEHIRSSGVERGRDSGLLPHLYWASFFHTEPLPGDRIVTVCPLRSDARWGSSPAPHEVAPAHTTSSPSCSQSVSPMCTFLSRVLSPAPCADPRQRTGRSSCAEPAWRVAATPMQQTGLKARTRNYGCSLTRR
jgi:hypothetical protein